MDVQSPTPDNVDYLCAQSTRKYFTTSTPLLCTKPPSESDGCESNDEHYCSTSYGDLHSQSVAYPQDSQIPQITATGSQLFLNEDVPVDVNWRHRLTCKSPMLLQEYALHPELDSDQIELECEPVTPAHTVRTRSTATPRTVSTWNKTVKGDQSCMSGVGLLPETTYGSVSRGELTCPSDSQLTKTSILTEQDYTSSVSNGETLPSFGGQQNYTSADEHTTESSSTIYDGHTTENVSTVYDGHTTGNVSTIYDGHTTGNVSTVYDGHTTSNATTAVYDEHTAGNTSIGDGTASTSNVTHSRIDSLNHITSGGTSYHTATELTCTSEVVEGDRNGGEGDIYSGLGSTVYSGQQSTVYGGDTINDYYENEPISPHSESTGESLSSKVYNGDHQTGHDVVGEQAPASADCREFDVAAVQQSSHQLVPLRPVYTCRSPFLLQPFSQDTQDAGRHQIAHPSEPQVEPQICWSENRMRFRTREALLLDHYSIQIMDTLDTQQQQVEEQVDQCGAPVDQCGAQVDEYGVDNEPVDEGIQPSATYTSSNTRIEVELNGLEPESPDLQAEKVSLSIGEQLLKEASPHIAEYLSMQGHSSQARDSISVQRDNEMTPPTSPQRSPSGGQVSMAEAVLGEIREMELMLDNAEGQGQVMADVSCQHISSDDTVSEEENTTPSPVVRPRLRSKRKYKGRLASSDDDESVPILPCKARKRNQASRSKVLKSRRSTKRKLKQMASSENSDSLSDALIRKRSCRRACIQESSEELPTSSINSSEGKQTTPPSRVALHSLGSATPTPSHSIKRLLRIEQALGTDKYQGRCESPQRERHIAQKDQFAVESAQYWLGKQHRTSTRSKRKESGVNHVTTTCVGTAPSEKSTNYVVSSSTHELCQLSTVEPTRYANVEPSSTKADGNKQCLSTHTRTTRRTVNNKEIAITEGNIQGQNTTPVHSPKVGLDSRGKSSKSTKISKRSPVVARRSSRRAALDAQSKIAITCKVAPSNISVLKVTPDINEEDPVQHSQSNAITVNVSLQGSSVAIANVSKTRSQCNTSVDQTRYKTSIRSHSTPCPLRNTFLQSSDIDDCRASPTVTPILRRTKCRILSSLEESANNGSADPPHKTSHVNEVQRPGAQIMDNDAVASSISPQSQPLLTKIVNRSQVCYTISPANIISLPKPDHHIDKSAVSIVNESCSLPWEKKVYGFKPGSKKLNTMKKASVVQKERATDLNVVVTEIMTTMPDSKKNLANSDIEDGRTESVSSAKSLIDQNECCPAKNGENSNFNSSQGTILSEHSINAEPVKCSGLSLAAASDAAMDVESSQTPNNGTHSTNPASGESGESNTGHLKENKENNEFNSSVDTILSNHSIIVKPTKCVSSANDDVEISKKPVVSGEPAIPAYYEYKDSNVSYSQQIETSSIEDYHESNTSKASLARVPKTRQTRQNSKLVKEKAKQLKNGKLKQTPVLDPISDESSLAHIGGRTSRRLKCLPISGNSSRSFESLEDFGNGAQENKKNVPPTSDLTCQNTQEHNKIIHTSAVEVCNSKNLTTEKNSRNEEINTSRIFVEKPEHLSSVNTNKESDASSSHFESPSASFISQKRLPSSKGCDLSASFLDAFQRDDSSFESGVNHVAEASLPHLHIPVIEHIGKVETPCTVEENTVPFVQKAIITCTTQQLETAIIINNTVSVSEMHVQPLSNIILEKSSDESSDEACSVVPETQNSQAAILAQSLEGSSLSNRPSLEPSPSQNTICLVKLTEDFLGESSDNLVIVPKSQTAGNRSSKLKSGQVNSRRTTRKANQATIKNIIIAKTNFDATPPIRMTRSRTRSLPISSTENSNTLASSSDCVRNRSRSAPCALPAKPPIDTRLQKSGSNEHSPPSKPRVSFASAVKFSDINAMTPCTRGSAILAMFDTPDISSKRQTPRKSILKNITPPTNDRNADKPVDVTHSLTEDDTSLLTSTLPPLPQQDAGGTPVKSKPNSSKTMIRNEPPSTDRNQQSTSAPTNLKFFHQSLSEPRKMGKTKVPAQATGYFADSGVNLVDDFDKKLREFLLDESRSSPATGSSPNCNPLPSSDDKQFFTKSKEERLSRYKTTSSFKAGRKSSVTPKTPKYSLSLHKTRRRSTPGLQARRKSSPPTNSTRKKSSAVDPYAFSDSSFNVDTEQLRNECFRRCDRTLVQQALNRTLNTTHSCSSLDSVLSSPAAAAATKWEARQEECLQHSGKRLTAQVKPSLETNSLEPGTCSRTVKGNKATCFSAIKVEKKPYTPKLPLTRGNRNKKTTPIASRTHTTPSQIIDVSSRKSSHKHSSRKKVSPPSPLPGVNSRAPLSSRKLYNINSGYRLGSDEELSQSSLSQSQPNQRPRAMAKIRRKLATPTKIKDMLKSVNHYDLEL